MTFGRGRSTSVADAAPGPVLESPPAAGGGRTSSVAAPTSAAVTSPRDAARYLWQTDRLMALRLWAAAVFASLSNVAVLFTLSWLIGSIPSRRGTGEGEHSLIWILTGAVALFVVASVLPALVEMLGAVVKATVRTHVHDSLLVALLRPTGIALLEDPSIRDRVASATGETGRVEIGEAAVMWVSLVALQASGYVACVVISVHIWWMGLVLALMWMFVRRLVRVAFMDQAVLQYRQTTSRRRALYLVELLSRARDAKEVRVFGIGSFLVQKFRSNQRKAIVAAMPAARLVHQRALLGLAVALATYLLLGGYVLHGAYTGAVGFRELVVVLLMLSMTSTIGAVSWSDVLVNHGLTTIPDIRLITSLQAPAAVSSRAPDQPRPAQHIEFDNVHFRYPNRENDTLSGVCLELLAAKSTALVGANGAGKSTIVSLLLGLRTPTAGAILVAGQPLPSDPGRSWQESIAIVSQRPARFPTTLYRNVAMGALSHIDDADGVLEALDRTDLISLANELPDGLDTVLNRTLPGGVDLSGGQWQRVALARAIFAVRHGVRMLVLDEPTAAMDVDSEARFHDQFFDLTCDVTTLVISHRFSSVRRADQIYVLDDGLVTESGSHEELVVSRGTYGRMFDLQARNYR